MSKDHNQSHKEITDCKLDNICENLARELINLVGSDNPDFFPKMETHSIKIRKEDIFNGNHTS